LKKVFDFLKVEHFTGNGARVVIFAAVKNDCNGGWNTDETD